MDLNSPNVPNIIPNSKNYTLLHSHNPVPNQKNDAQMRWNTRAGDADVVTSAKGSKWGCDDKRVSWAISGMHNGNVDWRTWHCNRLGDDG